MPSWEQAPGGGVPAAAGLFSPQHVAPTGQSVSTHTAPALQCTRVRVHNHAVLSGIWSLPGDKCIETSLYGRWNELTAQQRLGYSRTTRRTEG